MQQKHLACLRRFVRLPRSGVGCYKALSVLAAARLAPRLGGWALQSTRHAYDRLSGSLLGAGSKKPLSALNVRFLDLGAGCNKRLGRRYEAFHWMSTKSTRLTLNFTRIVSWVLVGTWMLLRSKRSTFEDPRLLILKLIILINPRLGVTPYGVHLVAPSLSILSR